MTKLLLKHTTVVAVSIGLMVIPILFVWWLYLKQIIKDKKIVHGDGDPDKEIG